MTQPYPLPREKRETAVLNGDGSASYGPFGFKIFDTADVDVWTLAAGAGEVWQPASATVTKTSGQPFDTFSVTFAAALPATTKFIVYGRRLHERSVQVTRSGAIDSDQLEKELSKQGVTLDELRRDVDRAHKAKPGEAGALLDADEIGAAEAHAEAAAEARGEAEAAAMAAVGSAGVAAGVLAEMRQIYLGAFPDDASANAAYPTRPAGARYFNTTDGVDRVWKGSAWEAAPDVPDGSVTEQKLADEAVTEAKLSAAVVNRLNVAKLDRIDPRDTAFGAVMGSGADATANGVAMDLALQAVLADNLPLFIPPGAGLHLEAAQITTKINESDVEIYGEGDASRIVVIDNAPLFQIDATAGTIYRLNAREFFLDFIAAVYDQTIAFKVLCDVNIVGGLRSSEFRSITFRGGNKFFFGQATKLQSAGGWNNVPGWYGYIKFTDIDIPQHSRYPTRVVHFESGHGADCMLTNSQLRTDPVTGYAWESGDGASLEGDMVISGNRMVIGSYGVRIKGPTDHSQYSRNVQIVGNQIDVMTDGIGWLSDLDGPILNNAQLAGTANDWRLEGCRNVDIRDIAAAEGRHGLFGVSAGNGTKKLWRIEKSDTTQTKGIIVAEITADLQALGLAARGAFGMWMLRWNSATWGVQVIHGPVTTASGDFTLQATVNGDGVDIEAVITNTTVAGPIYGQMTLTGANRKVTHL